MIRTFFLAVGTLALLTACSRPAPLPPPDKQYEQLTSHVAESMGMKTSTKQPQKPNQIRQQPATANNLKAKGNQ